MAHFEFNIKIYQADIVNTFSEGEAIFINTT